MEKYKKFLNKVYEVDARLSEIYINNENLNSHDVKTRLIEELEKSLLLSDSELLYQARQYIAEKSEGQWLDLEKYPNLSVRSVEDQSLINKKYGTDDKLPPILLVNEREVIAAYMPTQDIIFISKETFDNLISSNPELVESIISHELANRAMLKTDEVYRKAVVEQALQKKNVIENDPSIMEILRIGECHQDLSAMQVTSPNNYENMISILEHTVPISEDHPSLKERKSLIGQVKQRPIMMDMETQVIFDDHCKTSSVVSPPSTPFVMRTRGIDKDFK